MTVFSYNELWMKDKKGEKQLALKYHSIIGMDKLEFAFDINSKDIFLIFATLSFNFKWMNKEHSQIYLLAMNSLPKISK